MDILTNVNAKRDPVLGAGCRAAMAPNAIELAASFVLLHRRTGNRAVRAKHAAIACERLKSLAAALAVIEELAGVGGHGLDRLMAALRARNR
jgi:hypothetical protein